MSYKNQTDYLYHHGIKGQKWGVRRYQNADGSYTEAGKKRQKQFDTAFKPGKDGKASNAEKIINSSRNIVNEVSKSRNPGKNRKINSNNQNEASKMSDAELNRKIDRMARERRYRDLKYEQDTINTGRNKVDRILEVAGSTAAIAASAATIASAVYAIKHA